MKDYSFVDLPAAPDEESDPWRVPDGEHVTVLPEDLADPVAFTTIQPGGIHWSFPPATPNGNEES